MTDLGPNLSLSLVLVLSLLLDQLGEPPSRIHPVVGMGRYLTSLKRRNRVNAWVVRQGATYLMLGCLVVTALAWLLGYLFSLLPSWLELFLLAVTLKPLFSFRALLRAGDEVKQALRRGNLPQARRRLSWHLVSRDTTDLSESEVAGAAVESLAENLSDSVVAPLFYFALLGLPGAALYRFVNTADAVLGYRTQELEYFGKPAARLDDALNFIPARFTAALLYIVLALSDKRPHKGLNAALGAELPSPNAGWTMGMVAGGLDLQLAKRGVYMLNAGGEAPGVQDIVETQRLLVGAALLGTLALIGLAYA